MNKLMVLSMLGLFCLGCSTGAINQRKVASGSGPSPAVDIGEDVMKPMDTAFKIIAKNITDGSKNPDSISSLNQI